MLRFVPHYKQVPWGGTRFAQDFRRTVPSGAIGEAWELVDLDSHQSRVLRGPHEGKTLGDLWQKGLLGGSARGRFPFLLKWLDTRQKLSVQVHPDPDAVKRLGKGASKTEAWYVAQSEPASALLLGHYPGFDAATLRLAAQGGTIAKWLYEVKPRVGDMVFVPAGTLHAIGAGYLILEVQEPSDTTFRVYDWGRTDANGNGRELHLEEACQSVRFAAHGTRKPERESVKGPCFAMRPLRAGFDLTPAMLRVLVAVDGDARLKTERGEEALAFGDVVVAEASDGAVRLIGGSALLVTES